MALLTVDELRENAEATKKASLDERSDEEIQLAIDEASATLSLILGYSVANDGASLTVRVTSTDEALYLPQRVRSVTSVTVDGTALASDSYHLSTDGFTLLNDAGAFYDDTEVVITGSLGFAESDEKYILAKKCLRLMTIRQLIASYADDDVPFTSGYVTGYSSGDTNMSFFTPGDSWSGDVEIDRLLKLIGVRPKKATGLYTLRLSSGARDITFDDILAGRERVEDSFR